uniref:Gfo/Idh/MocA-like oxidoreductase N-terminal domain-containing protein n=1 Tax=Panagrolaimus sp. PS1159 TaxID=55785 RepID=A0AC35EVS3_9BILA
MPQELKWGIVGCGKISHDFAKAMKNCVNPNKIHALAASKKEKADKLKKELELDDNHKDVVFQAIEAGKNILCEKPIGVNVKEAKEMYEKAKEKNVFLMEATWSRFFPAYQHIRKVVKDGSLGKILGAGANFCVPSLDDNRKLPNEGSTPANDIGIYAVQYALWCIGEKPDKIVATGELDKNGCDIWASIILKFPSGAKATLFYSSVDNSPNTAYVSFKDGHIEIPGYFWCPEEIIIYEGDVEESKPRPPPMKFPFNDDSKYNFNHSSGLRYEADHVYECLSAGKKSSDVHTPDESLKVLEVLDEIRKQIGVVYRQDK